MIKDLFAKIGAPDDVAHEPGYYVEGDGGEGSFVWDAASTAPHDGGLCIAPNPQVPGRWIRQLDASGVVDVRWFGAWGGPGWVGETAHQGPKRSNAEAFEAAIRSLAPSCVPTYFGPRVLVPPGRYTFDRTLLIDRAAELVGVGAGAMSSSWLECPKDTDGVRVFRDLPASSPGLTPPLYQRPRGDMASLSQLRITGHRGAGGHGIRVDATCHLADLFIAGFEGNGVHVDCSVPSSNANAWAFERVRVDACNHGFYFNGSDTNAGHGIGLNATSCRGWGILDESFLGNYFFGAHTASCTGSWKTTNPNARSIFVGCYSEGDQDVPDVAAPSMMIGGISGGNAGTGGFLGEGLGSMRLRHGKAWIDNDADASNAVRVQVGSDLPGTALEVSATDDSDRPLRLRYERVTPQGWATRLGWWALEYAGLTAGTALRICTQRAAEWSRGLVGPKVSFDNGFLMGRGSRVLTSVGVAPPTTGSWAKGDRVINGSPDPGEPIGWVCVTAGAPGTWKPYGRIET